MTTAKAVKTTSKDNELDKHPEVVLAMSQLEAQKTKPTTKHARHMTYVLLILAMVGMFFLAYSAW